MGKKSNNPPEIAKATHEIYQYAADVSQPEASPAFASNEPILEQQLRSQWNLERIQQNHFEATAKGNIRGLATGHSFTLEHHSSDQANRSWVVRSSTLTVMDLAEESQRQAALNTSNQNTEILNQLLGDANNNQKWFIECALDLIPSNIVIRAPFIEKPKGSLQTALVVGEGG